VRAALIDDLDAPGHSLMDLGVVDLEVIDLSDPRRSTSGSLLDAGFDRRSFEDRYATLAFGLGVVPRRVRPDDPLWQRPAGLLLTVSAVLAFLFLLSTA
jgi:hypothetical protein